MRPLAGWLLATLAGAAAMLARAGVGLPDRCAFAARAVAVPIKVSPIPDESSDVEFACPAALLLPVEVVGDRSVSPPAIAYHFADSGEPADIEWSWGISAYELGGRVHIVAPDGKDLMVEGVVADDLGGGGRNEFFNVCDVRSLPRRAGPLP